MENPRAPYIGVTGFTEPGQVEFALSAFPKESNRALMIGILVSKGGLKGEQNQAWFRRRVPPVDVIGQLVSSDSRALNIFHYLTDEPETLGEQLISMYGTFGPLLHGFQINFLIWPDPENLRTFRNKFPRARLILQITDQAFGTILGSPKRLAARLQSYRHIFTNILLDASAGQGKALDANFLMPFLDAIHTSGLDEYFGITVAGGLSASTLKVLEPIVSAYPDISIDAEGRLRDMNDALDQTAVRSYLLEAATLFKS